ncbi:hypothetical protein [Nocardia sp. SYP-A9097]|uniref:hypothetical protein n=1 Tax=Nocardia sp. SYP-A9097 TaxID=2663237 RepID=UPI00189128F6|nr:hypothetical protein [Nocardia sp. SYP-A9097]
MDGTAADSQVAATPLRSASEREMSSRGQTPIGDRNEHQLVVDSDRRDPPDLRRLSRAVIALAKDSTTAEEEE